LRLERHECDTLRQIFLYLGDLREFGSGTSSFVIAPEADRQL
jgi:hypothetical protein